MSRPSLTTLLVDLTLTGPVLSHSTGPGKAYVDSPVARDMTGMPALPDTLVQGVIRDAALAIREYVGISHKEFILILGDGSNEEDNRPVRGRLQFSDFVTDRDPVHQVSIEINDESGAADDGQLQLMETLGKAGEAVVFRGTISFLSSDDSSADRLEEVIIKALRWSAAFGSNKSVGFGQVSAVSVSRKRDHLPESSSQQPSAHGLIHPAMRFSKPVCVSKRRISENVFESDEVISGGVVRGAIATMMFQLGLTSGPEINKSSVVAGWEELGKNFNLIRYSFLFPSANGKRPVCPPLSLVKLKSLQGEGHDIDDAAEHDDVPVRSKSAPAFAIDWKERADVDEAFGWPQVRRDLRVHVKIDADLRRAEDGKLFGWECVLPDELAWMGTIDFSGITDTEERSKTEQQLRAIVTLGLHFVGKTAASATVILRDCAEVAVEQRTNETKKWVVTLQTPTLLCDPVKLSGSVDPGAALQAEYRTYWKARGFELVQFFATQTLAGGEYLRRRFRRDRPYEPFLLTDPGSCFVLDVSGDKPVDFSGNLLPLPAWVADRHGDDWKSNPYLPSDGFGEVTVNLDVKGALAKLNAPGRQAE